LSYFTGKYNFRQGFGTGEGFVSDGRESSVKGYGAPLGFFVISDKEPKRRLEPRVLKIPHASGVQRITVNLCRAKYRTASFRWRKIALTSV
jgi:hypothetical protein